MAEVLLVEDDALVRGCLSEVLAYDGWRVSEADDATEALDRIAIDGVPGVLVTDMELGGEMSGLALIAATRLRWPEARAVLISGTDMEEPALDPGDRFLRKPFDVDALTRAVSELAVRRGAAGLDHALP
jgi:CheY-like chemotaxis protein